MGHSSDSIGRMGFCDSLVGQQELGWGFTRRWYRDFAGMSLRGVLATLAPAVWIQVVTGRSSALVGIGGVTLGAWYTLAWAVTLNTDRNTWIPKLCDLPITNDIKIEVPVGFRLTGGGEFLWGAWLWFVYALEFARMVYLPADAAEGQPTRQRGNSGGDDSGLRASYGSVEEVRENRQQRRAGSTQYMNFEVKFARASRWLLRLCDFLFVGFLVRCLWCYWQVEQEDMRNRDQTLYGMLAQPIAIALGWVVLIIQHCARNYQPADTEVEGERLSLVEAQQMDQESSIVIPTRPRPPPTAYTVFSAVYNVLLAACWLLAAFALGVGIYCFIKNTPRVCSQNL
eukprot:NODE_2276_length_1098_cov_3.114315_g2258_i0.p1 GENE.NODE_2276_length_1098_cov_3.114315_g2258_i0~~NODE_2276_length_1098_cov_3.114315_g2258_i0.p1  ORF type:complete len:348 (-),score=52.23 NODE_2276_length_1098_cov_3.114315_g2258_i0:53-1075(-)